MQTLYYSTSNWIRHTDNIVDLEQYRRKLSQAEDHQPAEGPELIVLPQPSAPRTRRSQRLRRRTPDPAPSATAGRNQARR